MLRAARGLVKGVKWVDGVAFYQARGAVANIAFSLAQAALAPKGANVVGLQIGSVTLPASNEAQIVTKLVTQQASATAQNVQAANQINAQITVLVGQINQEIALFLAQRIVETQAVANGPLLLPVPKQMLAIESLRRLGVSFEESGDGPPAAPLQDSGGVSAPVSLWDAPAPFTVFASER